MPNNLMYLGKNMMQQKKLNWHEDTSKTSSCQINTSYYYNYCALIDGDKSHNLTSLSNTIVLSKPYKVTTSLKKSLKM